MLTTWTSSLGPMTIAPLPNTEGGALGLTAPDHWPVPSSSTSYVSERETSSPGVSAEPGC